MGDVFSNQKSSEADFALQQPDYDKAERLALDLLEKYDIMEPPVVAVEIATKEGLRVFYADFSALYNKYPKVSGFINPKERCMYVNRHEPPQRQNFTIAHELGHYLLGHTENEDAYVSLLFRTGEAEKKQHPFEWEANRFAADLLMPRLFLEQLISEYSFASNRQLARVLGVSELALKTRRDALDL